METIIMNPIGKKKPKSKKKLKKKMKKSSKKLKKGGKKMAKKKSRKAKKLGLSSKIAKMISLPTKKKKAKSRKKSKSSVSSVFSGRRTRPVFYQIGKSTIKRSPKAKVRYATMLNPIKFIRKSLGNVVQSVPEVIYAGAGYIGIGYVGNLISSTTGFKFTDNPPVRQLTKLGITIGLSALAGMWNVKASKMVFLGGMLNVGQDVWSSYEIFKAIPISVPTLPASAPATTTPSVATEEGAGTLLNDKQIDTLITNSGEAIF